MELFYENLSNNTFLYKIRKSIMFNGQLIYLAIQQLLKSVHQSFRPIRRCLLRILILSRAFSPLPILASSKDFNISLKEIFFCSYFASDGFSTLLTLLMLGRSFSLLMTLTSSLQYALLFSLLRSTKDGGCYLIYLSSRHE